MTIATDNDGLCTNDRGASCCINDSFPLPTSSRSLLITAMSKADSVTNGSREASKPATYEEIAMEIPEQTVFTSQEISQGSFDDDDGLEMVPVVLTLRQSSALEDKDFEDERPSNERLLLIAFVTFATFTMLQTVAAFVAGSEAMMGDSGAMFVDAVTYLFNLEEYYQEPQHLSGGDALRRAKLKRRTKRKLILRMELIPPVISVATLLCVTAFVLHSSLRMILLDAHRARSEQGDPNLLLMLVFSCANLVLDLVNVFCFARAKRLCGYATSSKHLVPGGTQNSVGSPQFRTPKHYAQLGDRSDSVDTEDDLELHAGIGDMTLDSRFEDTKEATLAKPEEFQDEPSEDWSSDKTVPSSNGKNAEGQVNGRTTPKLDESDDEDALNEEANLNMCSAYTVSAGAKRMASTSNFVVLTVCLSQHVFADTLRSLAVIVAATVAEVADGVTSEEADATAAVVVSALILLSLLPLLSGLVSTFGELRSIHAEERDERISLQHLDSCRH
jgi:Co/Zn/Cd efflux system component